MTKQPLSTRARMRNDVRIFSVVRPSGVLGYGYVSSKLKELSQKHNPSNLTYHFNRYFSHSNNKIISAVVKSN